MAEQNEISVVLVGNPGTGESTLVEKLTGNCPGLGTQRPAILHRKISNELTLRVTDFIGLHHNQDEHKYSTDNLKTDIFVYCTPISSWPSFERNSSSTMKSLQETFGVSVWEHCIIVFTGSNNVWECFRWRNKDDTIAEYKQYITHCGSKIQQELNKLDAMDLKVKPVFGFDPKPEDQNTILAIPAGDNPDDSDLPDLHTSGHQEVPVMRWEEIILIEIIRIYDAKLLQYYKPEIATIIAKLTGEHMAIMSSDISLRLPWAK